ncbi:hypothetical protein GGR52DRAFT_104759 [Hypoxylon sp. FL1284]|nr:hypothetical protein GGR52DRAFT_104759 [Hypoxylon sp. FL1284]
MRKIDASEEEELGELEDKTEALTLRSKRTERARKRQAKKASKSTHKTRDPLSLPYELVLEILGYLRPSDVFRLARVSKAYHKFITEEQRLIVRDITAWRYVCLDKCFRLPVIMDDIDPSIRHYVQSPEHQDLLVSHKRPFQHIQPPDAAEVCTCLTCVLRWSSLCLIVDFSYWQRNLDVGEPIPMIARGKQPVWNQSLITTNAAIVHKALRSPLWHARLLEAHLDSTTRSIRRHAENRGNKRRRFQMSKEEMDSGSDKFLERSGPPSIDIPFHRDNYYMLEAYLPNRGWSAALQGWMYAPAEQHDMDLQYIVR